MEYKVWEYIYSEGREFLRFSGDNKEEAINHAEFWKSENSNCIVYEEDYEGNRDIINIAGENNEE